MFRQAFATITCLSVLFSSAPAVAGEPLEDLDPQDEDYRKKVRDAEEGKRDALQRKSPLHFLTQNERDRVERTKPIVVVPKPIEKSEAGKNLYNACGLVGRSVYSGASGNVQVLNGGLEKDLRQAKTEAAKTEAVERAVEFAEALEGLCQRINSRGLTDADVVVLRKHFSDSDDSRSAVYQRDLRLFNLILEDKTEDKTEIKWDRIAEALEAIVGTPTGGAAVGTKIATVAFEGLAEFLIDRAKEEVLAFLKDEFTDAICAADPGVFIPKTCKTFEQLDAKMAASAMGSSLHAAAIEDLKVMPDKLLVLAWQHRKQENGEETYPLAAVAYPGTALRAVLPMLVDKRLRSRPLEYAASIYAADAIDCENVVTDTPKSGRQAQSGDDICKQTMAVMRLSSAVLRAGLENPSPEGAAVEYYALAAAFDLEDYFSKMPECSRDELGKDRFVWDKNKLNGTLDVLIGSFELIVSLSQPIYDPDKVDGVEVAKQTSNSLIAIVKGLRLTFECPTPANAETEVCMALAAANKGLTDFDTLIELAGSIQDEDWAVAMARTAEIVTRVVDEVKDEQGKVCDEHSAKADQSTCVGKKEFLDNLSGVARYISLIAEIANAKSSADVNATLQAAFPAGGYKRKYIEPSIAINGFLGMYGGAFIHSTLGADNRLQSDKLSKEFALFAPIGVQATHPVGRGKRPSYVGALMSVIDLGAITTSKWTSQEINPEQDNATNTGTTQTAVAEPAAINFAGLVAPGLFFTAGIASSPFVIGAGASFVPFAQKRTVTERDSNGDIEATDEKFLPAIRFGVFLAVDITFVSFGLRRKAR